jgi:hypothetical protein
VRTSIFSSCSSCTCSSCSSCSSSSHLLFTDTVGSCAGLLKTQLKYANVTESEFETFCVRRSRRATRNLTWSRNIVWRCFCSKIGLPRDVSDRICEFLKSGELLSPNEERGSGGHWNEKENAIGLSREQFMERTQKTLPVPPEFEIPLSHVTTLDMSASQ